MQRDENFFEVTLSSDAWMSHDNVDETFYITKVDSLQSQYTQLLLDHTVATLDIFYKVVL